MGGDAFFRFDYKEQYMQPSAQHLHTKQTPLVEVILVTGLSGAGKSTALRVFEDLGYFTVEGLPIGLIMNMATMLEHVSMQHYRGMAIGIRVDTQNPTEDVSSIMQKLLGMGALASIVFIEAQSNEILRRYATTRRPHPMERKGLGLELSLSAERHNVLGLRAMADFVVDTTNYSIHDLRRVLQERWNKEQRGLHTLKINLISFGFKYGMPKEADSVFDVRFLPNPYFDAQLRDFSGQDAIVVDYIFGKNLEQKFLKQFQDFILFSLALIEAEGRYRFTLAIGCTGGKHRSVATSEHLYKTIKQAGYAVALEHRHLALG